MTPSPIWSTRLLTTQVYRITTGLSYCWEMVAKPLAYAELKESALQIGIYHQQLKGDVWYPETSAAIECLESACRFLEDDFES